MLDRDTVDAWVKGRDQPAFEMTRRLIRTEGMLCGGSSGMICRGALDWLRDDPVGQLIAQDPEARVVVMLPDGIRNYVSKPWLIES